MDIYFFLKQRIDLIRHFYEAASAPFIETKRCITNAHPPFDAPSYDESGEPPFLTEWMQADVEHELVGRAAVSMLSEALKQFFATSERSYGAGSSCSKQFKKAFESGFISGYVACFADKFGVDWSVCPADLDILKQMVLARNSAQHSDLVLDHLTHSEKSMRTFPRPFFVRLEDEGEEGSASAFLSPTIHINKENLLAAMEQTERMASWLQQKLEEHQGQKWANRRSASNND